MQLLEQLLGLFGRIAQTHGLESAPGGGKAAGAQEDVLEQFLVGLGQVALVFGQEGRVKALAGAGPFQRDGRRPDVEGALGRITVGAVLGMVLEMELSMYFCAVACTAR